MLTSPACSFFLTLFSRIKRSLRRVIPFLFAACIARAAAAAPPADLAPPPPFPQIVAESAESEFVAPGVTRTDYRLETKSGPLSIQVVAVELHKPGVHLGTVVASDKMISEGETISSMAQRTHAVAGINADYFDIGQTNQPLNIVVQNGDLLRTPSNRVALDVSPDGNVHFEPFTFTGSVTLPGGTVPLEAVNIWPPQQGAVLLTSAFGALPPPLEGQDVTLVPLQSLGEPGAVAGNYRVLGDYPTTAGPIGAPTLALSQAALAIAPPPSFGDIVTIAAQTDPPLAEVQGAVGGGPLLVANGKPYDDPNAPAPAERNRRFPVSGAALTRDGTLLLITVDGRDPTASVGITRPEFGALMLGLGATDGMAFDSGGSATLVARKLGDAQATVLNTPSDGKERPVADGLFVYSDVPVGAPARLVLHPARIEAVRGAHVSVSASIVDAGGHPLGSAPGLSVYAERAQTILVRRGALSAELPVRVLDRVAHLRIEPVRPNPDPRGFVQLHAIASDASGRPLETDGAVQWTVDGDGSFIEPGLFHAAETNAVIKAIVGGAATKKDVAVGRHELPLPWMTGDGITLDYDFTGSNRFAYHNATYALPGDPLAFSVEIDGDGSGVVLRAAFRNRFGERTALTLARRVDWQGWQRRTIVIPGLLNPPVTLVSLYAVNSLGTPPVHAAGTIGFRNPAVVLPGTQ